MATRVSLQQSYTDQIMTPRQPFNWAQTNTQNTKLEFVTELEFTEEEKLLLKKSTDNAIHGSLKLHAFLPIQKSKFTGKKFPTSAESEECCITVLQESMTLDGAKGFVMCV
jgi:hypothetical protein